MTIAELIAQLQKFPPDSPVCIPNDMRGPQAPKVFLFEDYGFDHPATFFGYPSDDAVVIT